MNITTHAERRVALAEAYLRESAPAIGWSYIRTDWYRDCAVIVLSKPGRQRLWQRAEQAFTLSDYELQNGDTALLEIVRNKWASILGANSQGLKVAQPRRKRSYGRQRRRCRRSSAR